MRFLDVPGYGNPWHPGIAPYPAHRCPHTLPNGYEYLHRIPTYPVREGSLECSWLVKPKGQPARQMTDSEIMMLEPLV